MEKLLLGVDAPGQCREGLRGPDQSEPVAAAVAEIASLTYGPPCGCYELPIFCLVAPYKLEFIPVSVGVSNGAEPKTKF